MTESAVTLLPQPLSPTTARVSPGRMKKPTPYRFYDAFFKVEISVKVPDLQDNIIHGFPLGLS
jgi:hypothetical protein